MTAPLFLAAQEALASLAPGADLVLDGEEGHHAATVRRIGAGERVDVGDGAGRVARCVVAGVASRTLVLRVEQVDDVPPPVLRVTVVQALAKGGRDELAVETATEVGADEIVPWQAARSIVRWQGERGERARRKWADVAIAAGKQSRRAWLPRVADLARTADVTARVAAADLAVVLHETAERSLSAIDLPASGTVVLVVGPEGGITDDECAAFTTAGAVAARLGPEVLRSSTAATAALCVLATRSGRW